MMLAFSSTCSGTLVHLLCAKLGKAMGTSRLHYTMHITHMQLRCAIGNQAGASPAPTIHDARPGRSNCFEKSLFNGDFRAALGHFVGDALGLFFGDRFLGG